jgi:hypothetical protein
MINIDEIFEDPDFDIQEEPTKKCSRYCICVGIKKTKRVDVGISGAAPGIKICCNCGKEVIE